MESSSALSFVKNIKPALTLEQPQKWKYETDEFHGICEIAQDDMVIKCVFESTSTQFFDVLLIDSVIKARLQKAVSVERLADQLSADFPPLQVTVRGRAKTHGWITSTVSRGHH